MGSDLNQFVLATDPTDADLARRAAVHVADHIGAKHPHPLDEYMPRIAGAVIAKDPAVNAGVLELLAALGIRPDQIRRTP